MEYSAQANLGHIRDPEKILNNNLDHEIYESLAKLLSEEYYAYRRNFSGSIIFDINNESKRKCWYDTSYVIYIVWCMIYHIHILRFQTQQFTFLRYKLFISSLTFDEIGRDVKVRFRLFWYFGEKSWFWIFQGDSWGPARADRRNDGSSDWILNSQWSWNSLFSFQAYHVLCSPQKIDLSPDDYQY